jgi:hypothetical protein
LRELKVLAILNYLNHFMIKKKPKNLILCFRLLRHRNELGNYTY